MLDLSEEFLAPRRCFLAPIPEVGQAADLLDEAADAILCGDMDRARCCVRAADIPAVHAFASRIMGKVDLAIHRLRPVARPTDVDRVQARMPGGALKADVFARDGWKCRFCGVRVVTPEARRAMIAALPQSICWTGPDLRRHAAFYALSATLDHVVPHALGGTNDAENLVTTCWPCNFGRMDRLISEVGLIDPRTHPPILDRWDGLRRLVKQTASAPTAASTPAESARARIIPATTDGEWFNQLDRHSVGLSGRLMNFLDASAELGVSWSVRSVLIVRMVVEDARLQVFGIEACGDVHIPWAIGAKRDEFRDFAKRIALAIPDGVAYETPKIWVVRTRTRQPIRLDALLDAEWSVRAALGDLRAALQKGSPVNTLS
jgi:5-methylcytosine-specific restriction endonuclease McrA